jgi:predicted flap endonuclease-1-like 5' DNA nuclease
VFEAEHNAILKIQNLGGNGMEDLQGRKITRALLIFQVVALVIVFILALTPLAALGLFIAFIAFVAFAGVFVWLYWRFHNHPLNVEKHSLLHKANNLENERKLAEVKLRDAEQNRVNLQRNEERESKIALETLQSEHRRTGLEKADISSAVILGIGPKLKERLLAKGIVNAASVSREAIASVEGFGQAKVALVLAWKNIVAAQVDRTKPVTLPEADSEKIRIEYLSKHNENNRVIETAQENINQLSKSLVDIQPRLKQLRTVTFANYLNSTLSSKGLVTGLIAGGLILTQLCMGLTATTGAIVASIPTSTQTPTLTFTPTLTPTYTLTCTPTITHTPTITLTSTISLTPTITDTPTVTDTPSRTPTITRTPTLTRTATFTRTPTYTPSKTPTRRPTSTPGAIIYPTAGERIRIGALCNDGTSSGATGSGACSHHDGVSCWKYSDGSCTNP